jgi:hypothetical protein
MQKEVGARMSGQKPSLGRIVLVPDNPVHNNGAHVAPAIITHVNSDTSVNVRVLADASDGPECRRSITLVDELPVEYDASTKNVWCWPPRA